MSGFFLYLCLPSYDGMSHDQTIILPNLNTPNSKILHAIYIQNHPCVLILSAVPHEVFPVGALEARVCRTSAFRAPAGKTE